MKTLILIATLIASPAFAYDDENSQRNRDRLERQQQNDRIVEELRALRWQQQFNEPLLENQRKW